MNAVVALPIKRKRGAKVRKGPCAQIIPLPGVLIGEDLDELHARHRWMMCNYDKWETRDLDGVDYPDPMTQLLEDAMRKKWPEKYPTLSAARMRCDITKYRKVIVKRNQIKAWLTERGADMDEIKSEQAALAYMFDWLREEGLAH
jgi:hypothetical protein